MEQEKVKLLLLITMIWFWYNMLHIITGARCYTKLKFCCFIVCKISRTRDNVLKRIRFGKYSISIHGYLLVMGNSANVVQKSHFPPFSWSIELLSTYSSYIFIACHFPDIMIHSLFKFMNYRLKYSLLSWRNWRSSSRPHKCEHSTGFLILIALFDFR